MSMSHFMNCLAFSLLIFVAQSCSAADTSISIGEITLRKHERETPNDKLLIKSNKLALSIDLNRSAGMSSIANMNSNGMLLIGPYVLNTHDGTLVRQSAPGYQPVSALIDAHVEGRSLRFIANQKHWHCKLPLPPLNPFGVATFSMETQGIQKKLLILGGRTNARSGIVSVYPMTLSVPGCKAHLPATPLEFDHAMLIPQASRGAWWTFSVSEPRLAFSVDGRAWHYPELPLKIRSLLSAFVDDNRTIWIAVAMQDPDEGTQLFKRDATSSNWSPVESRAEAIPKPWLEGQILLSNPR